MLKYLNRYHDEFEEKLNHRLMDKADDKALVEYIKDTWRSLEIAPPIHILKFEYTEDESSIDINRYIFKREKRKKKKDRYKYKMVKDSRCGSLTTWIEIVLPVKNPKTNELEVHKKLIKKSMLIPLQDETGAYYIKGKKYLLLYQLLEKSTYSGASTLTLKSLMPIALNRDVYDAEADEFVTRLEGVITNDDGEVMNGKEGVFEDINHVTYNLPVYNIYMFKKEMPAILFYLANGLKWALDFLKVSRIISFEYDYTDKNVHGNEIWFPISSKCYLRVKNAELFKKYPYIQSVVGGLLTVTSNRFNPSMIEDTSIWIKKLGNGNNYSKGLDMLTFYNRLMDDVTKKILLLDEVHKRNVYALVRWMMMNFNELRLKDNMNLYNKRLRCNEYISSLLTIEFSKRLNRVIAMGNKATVDNYKEIFKFPGEILIQQMHASGILRFDDNINDMTFFSKFKITSKGPHSVGNHDSNRISLKQRSIHPSFLGNIDILVCGNSDPGTSAMLSPWSRMEGLYFDETKEEDHFMYNFKRDMDDYEWEHGDPDGKVHIRIQPKDSEDYYRVLNNLAEINDEINVYMNATNEDNIIVEKTEDVDAKNVDEDDEEKSNEVNEEN